MSEALGWGVVPPTVLRDGPFGEGMLQQFVEMDETTDVIEMIVSDDVRLRRIAAFDAAVVGLIASRVTELRASPLGLPIGSQTYPHRAMIKEGNFPGMLKIFFGADPGAFAGAQAEHHAEL